MNPFQKFSPARYLAEGELARVYSISRYHVAKVPKRKKEIYEGCRKYYDNHKNLQHELEIMQELYYHPKINIPKPEGIHPVQLEDRLVRESLVMQRLYGEIILGMKGDSGRKAAKLFREQESFVNFDLSGFINKDLDFHNAIYVPKEDKVYLIDFALWKKA